MSLPLPVDRMRGVVRARPLWRRGALPLVALTLACVVARAQPLPSTEAPLPAIGAEGETVPAEDGPFEGRVAAYLLSPDAGVAGLVFDDGRQVFVPPHLGARLAALVRPGQQVRVGPAVDDARGPGAVRAVVAVATGATLAGAAPEAGRPSRAGERVNRTLHAAQAAGTIRLRLHGPRGETNGLLLDNGTQVFFPPHVAVEAGSWLRPGRPIRAEGYGQESGYGSVLQATSLTGPNGQAVIVYGARRPTAR